MYDLHATIATAVRCGAYAASQYGILCCGRLLAAHGMRIALGSALHPRCKFKYTRMHNRGVCVYYMYMVPCIATSA